MNNYWIETGLVLSALWLISVLTVVITFAACHGLWAITGLYPPLAFLYVYWWHLWKTRPSLKTGE